MCDNQKRIQNYVDAHRQELVDAVRALVAVPSVKGAAEPGKPFGPGPAAALDKALELAAGWGLSVSRDEGYVGLCDLNGEEDALHILAHLDVVDPGTGWSSDPYQAVERDGVLYGRGVADDKGPALAAMLALRAVKETGIPLRKNARLILGTDEESGSGDIAHYYAGHPYAPHSISPDAEFPVINIEKGHFHPVFTQTWPEEADLPRVAELKGGIRLNVVPPEAEALVLGLEESVLSQAAGRAGESTGAAFELRPEAGGVRVTARGRNAHASTPDEGNNAVTALLALLAGLPLADCPSTRAVRELARLFPHGDNGGRALGIAQADHSGPLTLTFSLFRLDGRGCSGQFDARVPLCAGEENCGRPARDALARAGFQAEGELGAGHEVAEDSPFIRLLLDCYEAHTGRKGACLAIGGGTYVHGIPGGVAYGPFEQDYDCRMHGADERAPVEALLTCAKIYADVIVRLCS